MAQQITDSFTITIKEQAGAYTIGATGPKDIHVTPQPFTWPLPSIPNETLAALSTGGAVEGSAQAIQELGQNLYSSVFTPTMATAFGKAQGRAGSGKGVRLRLQIDVPELAALPWETMYDGQEWLAAKSDNPLVRTTPQPPGSRTLQKLQIRGPLRILFVGASPELTPKGESLPALKIEAVANQLRQLLKEDIDKKRIILDVLLNATLPELHQQLVKNYYILFFAGHGCPEGIYLDDGQGDEISEQGIIRRNPGDANLISAKTLAQSLEGKTTRLVFLAACNTGVVINKTGGLLTSFAQELIEQAHLPALVAMQYPISDMGANSLTAQFFAALAAFLPVDVALAEARKTLIRQGQVSQDLIAPVMYLQAQDGMLFQRARNWAAWGLTVALPILIVVGILAFLASQRAEEQRQIAFSRQLASQTREQLDDQLDLALLLSLEANRAADTVEARGSLLEGLEYSPRLITFLRGHSGFVSGVIFSPEGQRLASSSFDDTVILWDVSTGQPISHPLGHDDSVNSVVFSPDGKMLVSSSTDVLRLWNATTGQLLHTIKDYRFTSSLSMALSPDGKTLALGSGTMLRPGRGDEGAISLWSLETNQLIGSPISHYASVMSVAFSPDGKILAWGDRFKTVILWDIAASRRLQEPLSGHGLSINSVAFSPDGKVLASGSDDGTIILWDVASGQSIGQPLTHEGFVTSVAFSPNGKMLASGSSRNTLALWDLTTDQPTSQFLTGHTVGVTSVAFSSDSKMLASGSEDGVIILWNVARSQAISQVLVDHVDWADSTFFSQDSRELVTVNDGNITSWDVTTGQVTGQQPIAPQLPIDNTLPYIWRIAFSPDGKTIASGNEDGTVILWDAGIGKPIGQPFVGHTGKVLSVAFSLDGQILASGSWDNTIILWNPTTGQPIGQPLSHEDGVDAIAFSPDGKILAAASSNKHDLIYASSVILWDVATGQPIGQPLQHEGLVTSIAFSPNGKVLATGSYTNDLQRFHSSAFLWDVATGQPLGQPLTDPAAADNQTVAFSPDGKILVSLGGGGTINSWDVVTGQPVGQPIAADLDPGSGLAFNPDGTILASRDSWSGNISLWEVATGQRMGEPLISYDILGKEVVFSPDGKTLAASGGDSGIILWDVATRRPLTKNIPPVRNVALSPDKKILAVGKMDGTILLWDVVANQLIGQPLSGHKANWENPMPGRPPGVTQMIFSPNGQMLASVDDNNTIILWHLASDQTTGQPLVGHSDWVHSLAFSTDNKILASADDHGVISLWDVTTGQPLGQPLMGHTGSVYSLAFSPDSQTLASGSFDQTILLWDIATRQLVGQPFIGSPGGVENIAFSPDGKILASSSERIIILWDIATGQIIGHPLASPLSEIKHIAFSPNGQKLALVGDEGIIMLDVGLELWIARACKKANRNLTSSEWGQYFPDQPYHKTCPDLP